MNELENEMVKDYGRNLAKLKQIHYEELFHGFSILPGSKIMKYLSKSPVLNYYQNLITSNKVIDDEGNPMTYDSIKKVYQKELMKSINILKDSVLLPKVCLNIVDH